MMPIWPTARSIRGRLKNGNSAPATTVISDMARILIVSTMEGFPWGGSEELWTQAAKVLAQRHRVACSVHGWPELHPRIQGLEADGIKVFPRFQNQSGAARTANWFLPQALQLKPAEPIEEAIRMFRPDLTVISQGGNTDGLAPMERCRKWGVPYVNVIQAVPEGVYWPDDVEIERQRPLYHESKRLFFISERNREFLETQFATRFTNHEIVRNPFNVKFYEAFSWPSGEDPLRLACVARLELYAKGQDLLLDVLSLPKWRERALGIDFFGKGPNQQIIQEQIRRLNLTNLKICGYVEDVASVWKDHHALVLPSRQEGLPLALVEAFLSGRPAVVTRVGGNAELVEEGVNGFVAPAPTVELMDEALERLWENRSRLAEMGVQARRTAEEKIPRDPAAAFVGQLAALLPRN